MHTFEQRTTSSFILLILLFKVEINERKQFDKTRSRQYGNKN
jgi:hypothetical protein